jgi:hypothetical protein
MLGTLGAILFFALVADNRKVNADALHFFNLDSGSEVAGFTRMIKRTMGFAPPAS